MEQMVYSTLSTQTMGSTKLGSDQHPAKVGTGLLDPPGIGLPPSPTHTPVMPTPCAAETAWLGAPWASAQSVHEDPGPPLLSTFSSGDWTGPLCGSLSTSAQALQMAPACPPPQESKRGI